MNKKSLSLIVILLAGLAALSACAPAHPDTQLVSTLVYQTVVAQTTQSALENAFAQLTQQAAATATLAPAPTATLPAVTIAPPVAPTATHVPPSLTPNPIPCDAAQFVSDVTYPDGERVAAGAQFTKTWRLKNVGSCSWTPSYAVVFSSGNAMSGPASASVPANVDPGKTIDLSVTLNAPSSPGTYKGYWMLRNASGKLFGIGTDAASPFYVQIAAVGGFKSDAVPSSIYPYDFVASLCSANWDSSAGQITLPCPNVDQGKFMWTAVQMNPKFEGGRQENERTLWVHLDSIKGAWVQGFYPAYTVKDKDHFVTWAGCLDGSKGCDVTFTLDYKDSDGKLHNLGKWKEIYDGEVSKIDIDLSSYAGQSLQFVLGVGNNNATAAETFWFTPAIVSK